MFAVDFGVTLHFLFAIVPALLLLPAHFISAECFNEQLILTIYIEGGKN